MSGQASIVVNGRSLGRTQPTGVDQLPALVAARVNQNRLPETVDDATTMRPKRTGRLETNIWEQLVLPYEARRSVLVSLANSGPIAARRHVVMIHDLSPWDHPEWFSRPYRLKTSALNRAWARWSPLVLTPSKFTADRCTAVLGIDPSRLCVVGNAHRWINEPADLARGWEPYVLTVSTLSTRKNLNYLLDAWPLVRKRLPGLVLKVAGARGGSLLVGTDGGYSAHDRSGVEFLGYVEDAKLDELILSSNALVSASLYEGFNIPILDALVAGVPVAVSDIAVHRELYGDDAEFFDLADPSTCADALARAIERGVPATTRGYFADRFDRDAVSDRILGAVGDFARQ